jgi:hypothetical protein
MTDKEEKGLPGAPCKLSEDRQAKIIMAIEHGAYYKQAAEFAGIDYTTFNNWMKRGENAEEGTEYFNFFHAVKEAEGKAAVGNLMLITLAAQNGNWQAAAWKLERRYPEEYAKRMEIKAPVEDRPNNEMSKDELIRKLQESEKALDELAKSNT